LRRFVGSAKPVFVSIGTVKDLVRVV